MNVAQMLVEGCTPQEIRLARIHLAPRRALPVIVGHIEDFADRELAELVLAYLVRRPMGEVYAVTVSSGGVVYLGHLNARTDRMHVGVVTAGDDPARLEIDLYLARRELINRRMLV